MKNSVKKRQQSAFEASVENAKQANESIQSYQNWLLILGIAELTFLGGLIFKENVDNLLIIKVLTILLLLAFLGFIFGSFFQYKHCLNTAREYEKISNKCCSYLTKGIEYVNKFPDDIELPDEQITSDPKSNKCFFIFSLFSILVNIGIIILIVII